jgi:hypothetical protein
MSGWLERPRIPATMLNPALVAAIESVAAREYEATGDRLMTWPLAYLVAPMVLHRSTREALPRSITTHLTNWVAREPLLRAGFPYRAAELAPRVREALRFGVRHGVLEIDGGALRGTLRPPASTTSLTERDTLLKSAGLVGRWLTKIENPSTAFALLGVKV